MKYLILSLTLALFASCSSNSDEPKPNHPTLLGLWQITKVTDHGKNVENIEHDGLLITPTEFLIVHKFADNEIQCCSGFFNWRTVTSFVDAIQSSDVKMIKGDYKYYYDNEWELDNTPNMAVVHLSESELVIYESYPEEEYEVYLTYKKISNDCDLIYTPVNCE